MLREADCATIAKATQKIHVSEPTIHAQRKHIGRTGTVDMKRLQALDTENSRPKRLLAERDLGIEVLNWTSAARRLATDSWRSAKTVAC